MKIFALLVATLCATALAACGGDDNNNPAPASTPAPASGGGSSSGGGSAQTLDLTAAEPGPGKFAFDPKALNAKPGAVTIKLAVPGDLQAPHAIEVEGNGVEEVGQTVQPGGMSTVTADLKPGKYDFYCPVDSHRDLGMEGTLTVK
jgi:plastocyanin